MLRIVLGGFLAVAASTAAAAEEKLLTGPAPAWVRPAAELKPTLPPAEGQAVRVLRLDRQLHFGADGDGIYLETVSQVRTGQGLQGAGTISLSWDPSRDTVTVHKLRIVRTDGTIDLLARQSFNVIRRETNPTLIVDGRLTATLQPEDLRVGDQIEFAYTLVHHDPVMQGRTDVPLNLGSMRGAGEASLRAVWPSSEPIVWRAGTGLPAPKVTRRGSETELTLELKDLKPLEGPKGAPARFTPTRELEFSEFRSWADVAATVAPLFQKASILAPDSPLKAEVAKIRALSPDPKVRAAAALKLVQDQVRYLALLLTDGGYTPVEADRTWARRFGECKAKTALLIALLHELGIEAEPALVNAFAGEGLDRTLPRMSAFNHVLVRATIGGKTYWLDGTRTGDGDLDSLRVPNHRWALPVRATGAELIQLIQPPLDKPATEIAFDIDARGGVEAASPVHGELTMRGDSTAILSMLTANSAPADRERVLKGMWAAYPWIEVKTVELRRDGDAQRVVMEGTAKLRWITTQSGLRLFQWPAGSMGQRVDYKREPGPGADAPYAVPFPLYSASRLSIRVPGQASAFTVPAPDVSKTVAGRAWSRRTVLEGDRITIEASVRALAPEFPAAEAEGAAAELARMAAVAVTVQTPRSYRATDGDVAAWIGEKPQTLNEYIDRGWRLSQAGRAKEAIIDFNKALEIEPKSALALAHRSNVQSRLERPDLAREDLEAAAKIDPRNGAVQDSLGMAALREQRFPEAVAALTRAIEVSPNNAFAINRRAMAYRRMGETDKALADLDTLASIDPKNSQIHILKADVYAAAGDFENALKAVDAGLEKTPKDASLLVARGGVLSRLNRADEAETAFATSISIQPTAAAYLTRAANRPKSDLKARLADLDAAEKLTPGVRPLLGMRARFYFDAGKPAEVIPALNQALRANPRAEGPLIWRGEAYARSGQKAAALRDFGDLRQIGGADAMSLNNLCWAEARLKFELEAALADCDAALKLRPDEAAFLDSKGLALLQLGRPADALVAYDAAIKTRPYSAQSLYGRGVAKLRLGRAAEGRADIALARKLSDTVQGEFAGYGLEL